MRERREVKRRSEGVKRRERRGEERIGGGGKGREDDVNGVKRYEKWRGEERREEQERRGVKRSVL
jgi:hypothetical protein